MLFDSLCRSEKKSGCRKSEKRKKSFFVCSLRPLDKRGERCFKTLVVFPSRRSSCSAFESRFKERSYNFFCSDPPSSEEEEEGPGKRKEKELTFSPSTPPPAPKKNPEKNLGRLRHPGGLRPLPERLEPPPRPAKVEGRRRLYPGEVRPRRRRRGWWRRGSRWDQRRSCRRRLPSLRRCFVFCFGYGFLVFLRRPQRDHRVFFVFALWRRQAQVHRRPVCTLRERDGAGCVCEEGE